MLKQQIPEVYSQPYLHDCLRVLPHCCTGSSVLCLVKVVGIPHIKPPQRRLQPRGGNSRRMVTKLGNLSIGALTSSRHRGKRVRGTEGS